MRPLAFCLPGLLIVTAGMASADLDDANQCAAGLDAPSKAIYDATVDKVLAVKGAGAEGIVRTATMDLVKSGTVSILSAKSKAEAAGTCLRALSK